MIDGPVLLYDGSCGFCSRIVRFVLRRDPAGSLRFAPLQGEFGRRLIEAHPELAALDSVIWFEPGAKPNEPKILVESDAALQLARYLGGFWCLGGFLGWVPKAFRDKVYRRVARNRHCILPPQKCRISDQIDASRLVRNDPRS